MEITILKVVKADHFWAIETFGTSMSEETRKFLQLTQQMNDFFSIDQAMCVPAQGQLCAGRRPDDKLWYRVRVKNILHSKSGPQACCFLLDYAKECLIPCHWLREAPPQFMQLPWQAREFHLYGLQPTTLTTNELTFVTDTQPCDRYDTAANEYVNKLVDESCGARVNVHYVDSNGVSHVKLYLRRTTNTVCVNDDLVSKGYAKEDKEVKSNLFSPMANSPSAVPGGRVSPNSPPPLSPAPSQRSSPSGGLAAMLGLSPLMVTEPVQTTPTANTQDQAVQVEQENGTGILNNSNSSALPVDGAAVELDRLTMKSPDEMKTKDLSPAEKEGVITKQQILAGHSREISSLTTSPSVRAKEFEHSLQNREGTSKDAGALNDPSLKPAGKNLSPRRMLKAARTLKSSSGRIIGNGSIAVNPMWLKSNSSKETKWTPGASSSMNGESLQPMVGRQEVRYRRSFPPDEVKSSGHSVRKMDQVVARSSRSVESRLNAAYSQTSTLGKEWTQLVDKTRPVRQRSLSPIPVNVGTVSSNTRSPPMHESKEVPKSPRVSPVSISAVSAFGGATSAHATIDKFTHSNSAGMSESNVHSTGQPVQTQAAVLGNSAGRHDDISNTGQYKTGSSGGAAKSDAKAEGSSISSADGILSGGGDKMATPSVHTGYTPARLPRINLHGNPLRDSLFPTLSSGDLSTTEPSTSEGEESPVRRRNKVPSIGERLLQGLMPQKWEEPSRTQAQFTSHSPSGRPLSLAGHQMSALGLTVGDGVAVKGDIPPKPCTMLEKATFPEFIKQYLETQNFPAPSKVQAYCWPAIMRGRDLVAMAPAKMGKTLAYLLPLMTQLAQTAGFEGLPEGNGPRSIILCPYWNSARYVYDQCWNYIADQKSTKVLLIFGAGAEDDQMVPLINGCDLLIATPRCLLRMLEKRYTNLDRLCHLVVDDADTLTEVYTDEIKSLMRLYGKVIADQPERSAPRQIVLMARQWTAGIESFHKAYMTQPLLVFTSKVEEAVYSKVKQFVSVVPSTLRYTQLLSLLDQCEGAGHKIVVFVGSDKEAEDVTRLLKSYSHNTLCAHTDLHQFQLDIVKKEWTTHHSRDSLPVLVMTDTVIQDLHIRDATCVIHYSFALSPLKFSGRLACMSNSFSKDGSKEKKKKNPGCVSYILVTETCTTFPVGLQEIMTLVRRSGGHVSQELLNMCNKAWLAKQVGRVDNSFCHSLKAFGHCAEQARCKARHVVLPEVDQPGEGMPTLGYVKVLVTHVVDANCYYARILKHWDWDRKVVPRENTCLPLMADIGLYFSRQENKVPVLTVQVGDLCAVRDMQNTFHRVRVTMITATDFTSRARVFYIDEGKTEELEVKKLLKLPEHLAAVPAQAVEVFLCAVCPIDQDKQWTDKASAFTHALVSGKELEGRVALCLGHTLWVESLVERNVLQGIKATTNKHNIRRELVHVCLAEKNPDHVSLLRQACDGKIALPEYKPSSKAPPAKHGLKYSTSNPPPTATLPASGFDEVYVSAVEHPGLLYVQRKHYSRKLETLTAEVNNEEKLAAAPVLQQVSPGRLCVAVFPEDNRWYRARVQLLQDEEMCEVFYLDHGDSAVISSSSLKEPWEEVMQLPFQAIEACLGSILPLPDQQWTEESGDELWDMVFEKMLFAQVLSVGPSEHGNDNRYKIELYNTSAEYDIIVSQEMVMQGHGVVSGSPEFVNLLFPEVDDPAWIESHPDPAEQICLLCAQLCQMSDPELMVELAKQIYSIVINNPTKHEAMRESRGVSSVCLMLGYCTEPAVLESLVVSLGYMVINSQANCEEVRTAGGLRTLCKLLKKDYEPEVQKQLVWALKHLALNERNKEAIQELGGLRTLCQLLADSKSPQVLENVCCCLSNLVTENKTNCSVVAECGGLHTVCQLVKSCANNVLLEHALQLLQQLAARSANRAAIAEERSVEMLCERIQNNHSDKVLVQALRTLKAVIFRSEENVAVIVNRSGVREVIERYASSHQSPEISRHCKDLLSKFGSPSKTNAVTPAKPSINHFNGRQSEVSTSNSFPSPDLNFSQLASGMKKPNFSHHSSPVQSRISMSRPSSCTLNSNQSASLMKKPMISPQLQTKQPTSGVDSKNFSNLENSASQNSATPYHISTRKAQVLAHHWERHKTRRPNLEPVPEGNGEMHQEEDDDYDDMPPLETTEDEKCQVSANGDHKVQSRHPKVLWSQQKETVTLSVQLRGLSQKPNVTFVPTALHFRTFFKGTDYRLNLDLYDKVQPDRCSFRLTGSDVILTLRKEKPGPWPRLSRTKAKHPWLGIDFDRWEDVPSDTESEPDPRQTKNVPPLPQHKHKERGGLPSTLCNVILPEMDISSDTNSHLHDSDHYSDSDGEVGGSGYKIDPRFIGM
ncbi:uncharacterized protein [Branchiostoma lanceolatum]|uniref:uncharacterized protein isoform X2 n=1 Tax=Branchiostoma lanceolatum TaxID=7740 RepID=UPI003454F64C